MGHKENIPGSITRLPKGKVLAEWGPMRLVIAAFVGKLPQPQMSIQAARHAFQYLERIARLRGRLSRTWTLIRPSLGDPLAEAMLASVQAVGDMDLTPMAAVAGTISDAVADDLFKRGMTKVTVDNGGDIAVRLHGEGPVKVGIRCWPSERQVTQVIALGAERESWGVATSGLGGRSFTKGVASAATVVAQTASLADAAATSVANASLIPSEEVLQRPAEELQPETDIAGQKVTVGLGELTSREKEGALEAAVTRAESLVKDGTIFGALVAVQGSLAMTEFFESRLIL